MHFFSRSLFQILKIGTCHSGGKFRFVGFEKIGLDFLPNTIIDAEDLESFMPMNGRVPETRQKFIACPLFSPIG
jgi:hypothetical protein